MERISISLMIPLLAAVIASVPSAVNAQPRVYLMNPSRLEEVRKLPPGDRSVAPALKRLLRDAEKSLRVHPLSVTQKDSVPPSGDKHDFMSLSPYWWPDPNKPDGRPYIRRDGEFNPEREAFPDEKNLDRMIAAVSTLALAHFFTGEGSYAAHATELLRVWFIDSATQMNPNLNYAQAIRGRTEGRGSGIIESHQFPILLDAIDLLAGGGGIAETDVKALRTWFSEYLTWLRESPNGRHERDAKNNHGSWYDVQIVRAALFVGERSLALKTLEESKQRRIASQIEPDGTQPMELARTKAEGYSTFNLQALTTLAAIGKRVGVDLWEYETADGRSIRKALDFMLPYYVGEKTWTYPQIAPIKTKDVWMLLRAAASLGGARYAEAAAQLSIPNAASDRINLIY